MNRLFPWLRSELQRVELDARAHRGGNHDALQVGALRRCRLRLDDRVHQRVEVLFELVDAEGLLADRAVDDVVEDSWNVTPSSSISLSQLKSQPRAHEPRGLSVR